MIPKSVLVFFLGLCVRFPNITLCSNVISPISETNFCQEFRTSGDSYVNFFALVNFQNQRFDDEIFRYKFYVKGDEEIFILFTENAYAGRQTECYEFGINTSNPPASTFRTTIGGSQKVRTEERLPLSDQMPMSLEIVGKADGEVQMFVANKPYPLIRFPDNALEPNFISFASNGKSYASFFFNCERRPNENVANGLVIPDQRARPVVYISFLINSITWTNEKVSIDLYYNMTLFTDPITSSVSEKNSMLKLTKPNIQLPKLEVFSHIYGITRNVPAYSLRIDEEKIAASTNETFNIDCNKSGDTIYCSLTFGLEDAKYHLTYYPSGPLFSTTYAKIVNIKVFQSPNSASTSEIPFKGDIRMDFKIVP